MARVLVRSPLECENQQVGEFEGEFVVLAPEGQGSVGGAI